jgi:hypothetical protein
MTDWSRLDIRGGGACLKIPGGIDDPEGLANLLISHGRLRHRPCWRSDIAVSLRAEDNPLGPSDDVARR